MSYQIFIKRLFVYLKPHIGKLAFTSAVMVLATALEALIPEITGQIVDTLFPAPSEPPAQPKTALLFALALFAIVACSALFTLISTATNIWVSNKVIMNLRQDMFAKLLKLPNAYFDKHPTGKILSKLTFNVEQIAASASTLWLNFIKSVFSVLLLTLYLFYKNWQLSLTLLVSLPLVYWAVKASSQRMRLSSIEVQKSMGSMTHLLNESISGNALVKIYHAQAQISKKFNYLINNIRQQRFKIGMTNALNAAFVYMLIGLSLSIVVYFSAVVLRMSAGEFLSFFTAMGMLVKPAKSLVNINQILQVAMAAGKSVFGLIDEKEEPNKGKKTLQPIKGVIEFHEVSFGYRPNTPVLQHINLRIQSGKTVALVGTTGSGKSTLAQLLARFYTPNAGVITIDGVDISSFEVNSLRSQIAFVDQNVCLFDDTIRANIALGQTDTMPDATIDNAAKISSSTEFIEKMSHKFDTEIGEDGIQLSGGQRQRLAIARAIAKDSPILILDEATSALDSATETQVQAAISNMQKNRTTLIIAHRLSTIKNADSIVVLKAGRIIEQGSHQDLLSQNGEYATLYAHQFKD